MGAAVLSCPGDGVLLSPPWYLSSGLSLGSLPPNLRVLVGCARACAVVGKEGRCFNTVTLYTLTSGEFLN